MVCVRSRVLSPGSIGPGASTGIRYSIAGPVAIIPERTGGVSIIVSNGAAGMPPLVGSNSSVGRVLFAFGPTITNPLSGCGLPGLYFPLFGLMTTFDFIPAPASRKS